MERLVGPGSFDVEVAGDSHDRHNLDLIWQATSNQFEHRESSDTRFYQRAVDARVISDADNLRDQPRTIRVEIAGKKAGNITPAGVLQFRRRLHQLGYDRIDSPCKAIIIGHPQSWLVKLDLAEGLIPDRDNEAEANDD